MQNTPKQTMREFFARMDVRRLQQIQKENPFNSQPHKNATKKLVELVKAIGAESYLNI